MPAPTPRLGQGEYMVVEADESDRSFLLLAPVSPWSPPSIASTSTSTPRSKRFRKRFSQFVNRVPFYGAAVLCLDEPNVQAILPRVKRPVITYGTSSQADLVISDVKLNGLSSEFRLTYHGEDLGDVPSARAAGNSQRAQCRGRRGRCAGRSMFPRT